MLDRYVPGSLMSRSFGATEASAAAAAALANMMMALADLRRGRGAETSGTAMGRTPGFEDGLHRGRERDVVRDQGHAIQPWGSWISSYYILPMARFSIFTAHLVVLDVRVVRTERRGRWPAQPLHPRFECPHGASRIRRLAANQSPALFLTIPAGRNANLP